ncbi:MAG: glycosylase [Proteobacteria bacterium]|nr:glycosylase [Pseudomonadota bacterium]
MFSWRKRGLVFDPREFPGRSWMQEFAQAPCVMLHGDSARVYFSCRPYPDAAGQYVSYSGFVDLDRSDLRRVIRVCEDPILPLGGLGEFYEFGTYPVSVIQNGEHILAYYAGWTRCESVPFNVAIGCAVSTDGGERFRKLGPGPILSYSPDEPFVISGPKIRRFNGIWYLFYIAGRKWKLVDGRAEPVYKLRLATSNDGINWRKLNKDLIPSRIEEDEAQSSPDVFCANGKYHMFFAYRHSADFRGRSGGYRIGYAYSFNLTEWTREDHRAGIDVSAEGWDSEMISYPHVFEIDGRVYMMYLGNQVGRHGFGLAELEGQLD